MLFYRLALLCDHPGLYKYAEHFVKPHEMFCCSLMQKILTKSDDVYVITAVDLFGHEIKIAAVFSYNGYTMNLCLPHLNRKIISIVRNFILLHNIFCVSAKTEWADFIKNLIDDIKKRTPDDMRPMDLLLHERNVSEETTDTRGTNTRTSDKLPCPADLEPACTGTAPVIIRCNPNDADALMPLQLNYISEEVLPPWKKVMPASERLNIEHALKSEWIYALKKDGAFISKVQTNAITKNFIQIGGVYTKEDERNKGYARTLVNHLLNEAETQNKKAVLYVRKKNESALSLYASCGFVKKGNYSIYYYKREI